MRYCTRAFDGLTASSCGTKGVIRFVIMVRAKGFAVKDVKCLVRERFLMKEIVRGRISIKERTYMTRVAIKTCPVVFAFKLAIRGRDGLVLYR